MAYWHVLRRFRRFGLSDSGVVASCITIAEVWVRGQWSSGYNLDNDTNGSGCVSVLVARSQRNQRFFYGDQ